jgi:hypothetical protein
MKKYQELENKIQELQKEVERLKQEEKAEQVDLSTCIVGQLVQLRNGEFACFQRKDGAFYVVGGLTYEKDGRQHNYALERDYDVVKVFPAEIPVLKGDISCLGNSFNFADTPQRDKYWRDIFTGKTNLSLGDMIFIQKWIIQSQG